MNSLKVLSGVECAPAVKLWFFELVMAVEFTASNKYLFLPVAACLIQLILVSQPSHYGHWVRLNAPF